MKDLVEVLAQLFGGLIGGGGNVSVAEVPVVVCEVLPENDGDAGVGERPGVPDVVLIEEVVSADADDRRGQAVKAVCQRR